MTTLSQVQAWEVGHLEEAAAHWTATAQALDEAFTMAYRQVQHPGGTTWEGPAANAAADHVGKDLRQVRGGVEALRDASAAALNGADDIAWAKSQVLEAVEGAHADAFVVGEDLSVVDSIPAVPAVAARRAQLAQQYRETINGRVQTLTDTDHQVASRISGHAEAVGFTFKEDGGETNDPTPQMRPEPGGLPPITDPAVRAHVEDQDRRIDELEKHAGEHGSIGAAVGAAGAGCVTTGVTAGVVGAETGPIDGAIAAGGCVVGAIGGLSGYLAGVWADNEIGSGGHSW